ncbi:MAG: RHS repeat protein [Prevotellaceae bacterium]|nr:RHS repeat protein [Prevotellaceae bacterium]
MNNKYNIYNWSANFYSETNDYDGMTTSLWQIDAVVAPSGETVEFEYVIELSTSPINVNEEVSIPLPGSASNQVQRGITSNYTYSYSTMAQNVLKKITFPNGEILFSTSNRQDLEAENHFADFNSLYPNFVTPQKLKNISIRNNTEEILHYNFAYSYLGNTSNYNTCRLMLDKVEEIGTGNYEFTYNRDYLPKKNSAQTDFWGFYNRSKAPRKWGENDVTNEIYEGTSIPFLRIKNNNNEYYHNGRDKSPNLSLMQNGMLRSVRYPTGGKTEFVYEPHEFANSFNFSGRKTYLKNPVPPCMGATNGYYPNGMPCTQASDIAQPIKIIIEEIRQGGGQSTFSGRLANIEGQYGVPPNATNNNITTVHYKITRENSIPYLSGINYSFLGSNFGKLKLKPSYPLNTTESIDIYIPRPAIYNDGQFANPASTTGTFTMSSTQPTKYLSLDIYPLGISSETPSSYNPNYDTIIYNLDVELTYIENKLITQGGGLRIKEIIDKTEDGAVASKRVFKYTKDEQSSGHLFIKPLYYTSYDFMECRYDGGINFYNAPFVIARSTPLVDLTPKNMALPVGYSQVEEQTVGTNETVKNVYYLKNDEYIYPVYSYEPNKNTQSPLYIPNGSANNNPKNDIVPNQPAIANTGNGLVEKILSYDKNDAVVKKQVFDYYNDMNNVPYPNNIERNFKNIVKYKFYTGLDAIPVQMGNMGGIIGDGEYLHWSIVCNNVNFPSTIFLSYYLQSDWWQLTKKTTTEYFGNKSIEQTVEYGYDDKNYLANEVRIVNSDGQQIKQTTEYNTQEENSIFVNFPLKQSKYIGNNFVEEIVFNYGFHNNMFLKNSVSIRNNNDPANFESRLFYHNYDEHGNPLYITKDDDKKIVCLWGYGKQYPVYELVNAEYSQLANVDLSILKLPNPTDDAIKAFAATLKIAAPNAMITTCTYKPLVGVTSITDPRGVTTYFSYDTAGRLIDTYIMNDGVMEHLQNYEYHYIGN